MLTPMDVMYAPMGLMLTPLRTILIAVGVMGTAQAVTERPVKPNWIAPIDSCTGGSFVRSLPRCSEGIVRATTSVFTAFVPQKALNG